MCKFGSVGPDASSLEDGRHARHDGSLVSGVAESMFCDVFPQLRSGSGGGPAEYAGTADSRSELPLWVENVGL